jgi:RHS repeat-associated protein
MLLTALVSTLALADGTSSTATPKPKSIGFGGGIDRDFSGESTFTGDVTFSFTLASLSGLDVSLQYSSNVHRQLWAGSRQNQSGWVGIGWSMTLGSIIGDIKSTKDLSDDRYYFVDANGSSEIVYHSVYSTWKIKAHPYWKVVRHVDGNGNLQGWTVTTDDGTTLRFGNYDVASSSFVFGYGYTNATRFFLGFGGIVTNPPKTSYSSAAHVPYQWDLSDIEDVNSKHITVSYQLETASLKTGTGSQDSTSLRYTRASYPLRISDRTGMKIEFLLAALGSNEYYNPWASTNSDPIQIQFQTRYLQSIRMLDRTGALISEMQVTQSPADIVSNGSTLRYLTSIRQFGKGGSALPSVDFEYCGLAGVPLGSNPGAIKKITHSLGGSVTYTYGSQSIANSRLDKKYTYSPTTYPAFEDWDPTYYRAAGSGSDFVAVPLTSGGSVSLRVYRWRTKGWQEDDSFPYSGTILNYWVANDYIVIKQTSSLLKVYRRVEDTWESYDASVTAGPAMSVVGLSSDFFVVRHNLRGTSPNILEDITVVYFRNRVWSRTFVSSYNIGSNPGDAHVAACGKDFFALRTGGSKDLLKVWNWNGTQWSNTLNAQPYGVNAFTPYAGPDYILTYTEASNPTAINLSIWKWTGSDWGSPTTFTNEAWVNEVLTADNYFVLRTNSPGFLIKTWAPNGSTWTTQEVGALFGVPSTSFYSGRAALGRDFIAFGWLDFYYGRLGILRLQNGAWGSGQIVKSYPSMGKVSGFIVAPVVNSQSLMVEVFKNNSVDSLYAYVDKATSWQEVIIGSQTIYPQGNKKTSFVQPGLSHVLALIDTSNGWGDEVTRIFKYGFGPTATVSYSGECYDFPVSTKVIADGMGMSYITSFLFENGVYDAEASVAKYNKATVTPPGNIGKMVSYMYNDLGSGDALEFVSVSNFAELDGAVYKTVTYNNSNAVVAQSVITNSVYVIDASAGIYHRRIASVVNTLDGVNTGMSYAYNDQNGLPTRIVEDVDAASELNQRRDRVTEITYAFQVNSQMASANMLSQVYDRKVMAVAASLPADEVSVSAYAELPDYDYQTGQFSVQFSQSVSYVVSTDGYTGGVYVGTSLGGWEVVPGQSSCSPWTSCSGTFWAQKGVTYYITAFASTNDRHDISYGSIDITYLTGTDSLNYLISWDRTEYNAARRPYRTLVFDGASWLTTDSVLTWDNFGNVIWSKNVDGLSQTVKMGYDSTVPIAIAANAAPGELGASHFEDGDVSTWVGGYGNWQLQSGTYRQLDGSGYPTPWDSARSNTNVYVDDAIVEAYVRFDNQGTYRYAAISKFCDANNYVRFELRKSESGVKIEARRLGTNIYTNLSSYLFNENQWYHLRGVIQGSTARLYIDGKLITSLSDLTVDIGPGKLGLSTYYTVASFDDARIYPVGARVHSTTYNPATLMPMATMDAAGVTAYIAYDSLGRKHTTTNSDRRIVAQSISYYSREGAGGTFDRTRPNVVDEITYPTGMTTRGLTGHWRFEGDAKDYSDNKLASSFVGNANAVERGYIGRALALDGSGDHLSVPYNSALNPSTGITLSARVRFDATGTYRWIIEKKGNYWKQYYMWWLSSGYLVVGYHDGSSYRDYTYAWTPTIGQWYHLSWTADGANVRIYIDGELKITYAQASTWQSSTSGDLEIGRNVGGGYYFNGMIDEAMVYNRGLTSEEVRGLAQVAISTAYLDGLGRSMQTQARDGVKNVIASVERDSAGREFRAWRPYSYLTGNKYDSLAVASSRASAVFGIVNPYVETVYGADPLSRPIAKKVSGRTDANEDLLISYSSTAYLGQTVAISEASKRESNLLPRVVSRRYTDKLGRTLKTASFEEGQSEEVTSSSVQSFLGNAISITDPRGLVTTHQYDFLGRIVQRTSPDEGTSRYMYDRAGRLRFMVDSLGLQQTPDRVLYWKYDSLGSVVEKGYLNSVNWGAAELLANANNRAYPTTPATWRKKYYYDPIGRLDSVWTNNNDDNSREVVEYFDYDRYSNVSRKGLKATSFNPSTVYYTEYTYDLLGRVVQMAFPLAADSLEYSYDQIGRLVRLGRPGGTVHASYTSDEKLQPSTEVLNPGGTAQTRTFTFDTKGRLVGIASNPFTYSQSAGYSGGVQAGETYYHGLVAYDSTKYGSMTPTPPQHAFKYRYDKYARLDVADNTAFNAWDIGTTNPTLYDNNGNIQRLQRGGTGLKQYTYPSTSNIVTSVGNWSYTADVTGNITSAGSSSTTVTYDPFTQLTSTETKANRSLSFEYDGRRERVLKKDSTSGSAAFKTLHVHGTSDFPIMMKTSSGNEVLYVYGNGGIVAARINGSWYYVHRDRLGSTRLIVNSAGIAVARFDYDPYGKLDSSYVSQDLVYRFTGQELDELGLYNFRARMYDPEIGLFYAVDPARQTHSALGYAGANPVSIVDRDGRIIEWVFAAAAFFVGGRASSGTWDISKWNLRDFVAAGVAAYTGWGLGTGSVAARFEARFFESVVAWGEYSGGKFAAEAVGLTLFGGVSYAAIGYHSPDEFSGLEIGISQMTEARRTATTGQFELPPGLTELSMRGYSPAAATDISQSGVEFISGYEGLSLRAYRDTEGNCTIGRGHLMQASELYDEIPRDMADAIFRDDVRRVGVAGVNRYIHAPLSQTQFDALASFAFQAGPYSLVRTGIARELNRLNYQAIPAILTNYRPLVPERRRLANAILFQYGVYIFNR